ncbi:hypothetical protein ZTR_09241 [Talaromyces verruculosus]|nr:hypothetical protein ZTR_09241 [Talaromyces verruculosus]
MEYQCQIQDVPGKGLGLVATTFIPKGTCVLSESPILKVPRSASSIDAVDRFVTDQINKLTPIERESFFSLSNAQPAKYSQIMGIVKTNALPLGSSASEGDIFLKASRINHACNHNSQNTWNEEKNQLTIYVFKDLEEGTEITIAYLDGSQDYSSRQLNLKKYFNFTCTCTLCSMPPALRQESDRRLNEISRLDESIGDGLRLICSPLSCLHDAHAMLQLLRMEGIVNAKIPRLYYDAFQIVIAHGDQARATVFLQKAHALRTILQGIDNPETLRLRNLAADPTVHTLYGTSLEWQSMRDGVPQSASDQELEEWLWRMPKRNFHKHLEITDLRADANFPAFEDLPGDSDINMEFYSSIDGFYYTPRKHWCFLAEVIEITFFLRLTVLVRDKAGKNVSVLFYTDEKENKLAMSGLRTGQTIAILYAEQHGFLDMSVGIRLEEIHAIKVCNNAFFQSVYKN